jgi:dihydropteridine reductase
VTNVDLNSNPEAHVNVIASPSGTWTQQAQSIQGKLSKNSLDAVVCTAGGWSGGNARSENFVLAAENSVQQSIQSSVIAAYLAAHHLSPCVPIAFYQNLQFKTDLNESIFVIFSQPRELIRNGLLVLTGAQAALHPTPGMIGYGLAKAGVHHLTKSLADASSGLPESSKVVAILPYVQQICG